MLYESRRKKNHARTPRRVVREHIAEELHRRGTVAVLPAGALVRSAGSCFAVLLPSLLYDR